MFLRHPFLDFFFFLFRMRVQSSLGIFLSFFFFSPEERHPTVLPRRLLSFKERLTPKNCELSRVNNAGVDWYSLQNQNPNFCIVCNRTNSCTRPPLLSSASDFFFFPSLSLSFFFLSRFNFLRIQIMLPSNVIIERAR